MLRYWRRVLYEEPFDGPLPRINLGVGCLCSLTGLFWVFSGGPGFLIGPMSLAMGLMFVFWGVSDLLPPERQSAIRALRAALLRFRSATIVLAVAGLLRQGLGS